MTSGPTNKFIRNGEPGKNQSSGWPHVPIFPGDVITASDGGAVQLGGFIQAGTGLTVTEGAEGIVFFSLPPFGASKLSTNASEAHLMFGQRLRVD